MKMICDGCKKQIANGEKYAIRTRSYPTTDHIGRKRLCYTCWLEIKHYRSAYDWTLKVRS